MSRGKYSMWSTFSATGYQLWIDLRRLLTAALLLCAGGVAAAPLDIAILGGRVIDPETGLDSVRNVGIRGGEIVAVTKEPLEGSASTIDATGMVVSPGFIDMHAHGQTILAGRVQALDGVTTALELEAGVLPVAGYYERLAKEGRPINYGAAVSWGNARIAEFLDMEPGGDVNFFLEHFDDLRWQERIATKEQLANIRRRVQEGLDDGGLGVGMLVGYAPGSGRKEYYAMSELAAENDVPTFTHARFLSMLEPGSSFEGVAEIVAAATGTGAQSHIVHLNSISLRDIGLIGGMIREAQAAGIAISTEAYPYGAGATGIGAAMFRGPEWRERAGGLSAASFDVGGERLSEAEFSRLQAEAPGTETVVHFLDLENAEDRVYLDKSVLFPGGVIASDGGDWRLDGEQLDQDTWPLPARAWSHPRSAGTYARFLRRYVSETGAVSLLEAIRRVSYGPARIMQESVPQMHKKGRLQVGADADVVVFDLDRIRDNATYAEPARASSGMKYVIVNGELLVNDGNLDTKRLPGRPIRRVPE